MSLRSRRPAHLVTVLVAGLLVALAAPGPGSISLLGEAQASSAAQASAPVVRVRGTELLLGDGVAMTVTGMSRSGTEYACAQGWGLFDGPVDDRSIDVMQTWAVDAVRVPVNESCWRGAPGLRPELSGPAYRQAVRGYVDRLLAHGLVVVLDLHLTLAGEGAALVQAPMPNTDHSVEVWRSIATDYHDVPGVAFELFNEPRDVSWACWRDGCRMPGGWEAAGMQDLVDAVRSTGATQPVVVEGLGWGNDLSGWAAHAPHDPLGQLVAGWHAYEHSQCATTSCWDATVAPVAATVPVLATEVGQTDCGTAWLSSLLDWTRDEGVSVVAWTWDVWPGCGGPTLVLDYDGTPTAQGAVFRDHARAVAAARTALGPAVAVERPTDGCVRWWLDLLPQALTCR